MGRFIGFAILAIVVLVTLAIIFRGDTRFSDAVNQTQLALQSWTPPVASPEPPDEEVRPPAPPLPPFPDTTTILSAERRAFFRTKDCVFTFIHNRESPRPFAKIQYAKIEEMTITPKLRSDASSVPRVSIRQVLRYRQSAPTLTEPEALQAALLPEGYKEILYIEFAWIDDEWVLDEGEINPVRDHHLPQTAFTDRRLAHLALVKRQFQEFRSEDLPDDLVVTPKPASPYGSTISQTDP